MESKGPEQKDETVGQKPSEGQPGQLPIFSGTPNIPPGYAQSGYSLAAIAPIVPHHVWTKDNWEIFLKLLKEAGDRDQSNNMKIIEYQDKQHSRENALWWFYSISGLLLLGFSCMLVWVGNSVGEKLILGIVAFASGFLAGRGAKKS